ncbi:DUF58 domain-containing protein [Anaerolineales bacterium HSG25]|nr:DUF58 domain-containing protein [Anaerolineales bacterium HSG25]
MNSQSSATRQLNTKLLPTLVIILGGAQLFLPYKGWLVMLIGLGGLWLISYFWSKALMQSLTLQREIRFGWAQVGDRLEERFTITNESNLPALWIELLDQSTMPNYHSSRVTGVGGTSRNRWQTRLVCQHRGVFTLGPTILRTGDPFGIYTVNLVFEESKTLTVTPPVVPLPTITIAPGGRTGEGQPKSGSLERTISVAGLREYIPGDDMKWIHWPTSARRNSLYVRIFDNTPAGDWWVFLDLDQQTQFGFGYSSTEEHGVILAASLADRGLRQGHAVGLVTHGDELVWLSPFGGDVQRGKILQALAQARLGKRSLAELLERARPAFGRIASLIIITAAVDGDWIEAVLPLLRRGAVATVLLFDPVSFDGTPTSHGTQSLLTNLGITCHIITRDVLDRSELNPDQVGEWGWRVTPSGRAIRVGPSRDMTWRHL